MGSYSPNILIYLEFDKKKIRLADVCNDTATIYERTMICSGTPADLVFIIDEAEERQKVLVKNSVSLDDRMLALEYV